MPPTALFVTLAADVLGQSNELLEAYLQSATTATASASDDDASAAAIAQTILALVIPFHLPFLLELILFAPKSRHPTLEAVIRRPKGCLPMKLWSYVSVVLARAHIPVSS
jgi:hypothetical protein